MWMAPTDDMPGDRPGHLPTAGPTSRDRFVRKMVIYTVVVTLALVILASVATVGVWRVWTAQLSPQSEGERVLQEMRRLQAEPSGQDDRSADGSP